LWPPSRKERFNPARIISTAIAVSTKPINFSTAETTKTPTQRRMRSHRTPPQTRIAQVSVTTRFIRRCG
jgi:hypothetical protein